MADKKNLCAMIPLALHQQVSEAKDAAGMTTNEYVTRLLTEYYEMKKNGGNSTMTGGSSLIKCQTVFRNCHADCDAAKSHDLEIFQHKATSRITDVEKKRKSVEGDPAGREGMAPA